MGTPRGLARDRAEGPAPRAVRRQDVSRASSGRQDDPEGGTRPVLLLLMQDGSDPDTGRRRRVHVAVMAPGPCPSRRAAAWRAARRVPRSQK